VEENQSIALGGEIQFTDSPAKVPFIEQYRMA